MYILFHNTIFDPAEVTLAIAYKSEVHVAVNGSTYPMRIETGSPGNAELILDELFRIMIDAGLASDDDDAGPEFELDDDEMAALDLAAEAGYQWIARDKNGQIFCYIRKPEKVGPEYQDTHTPDPRRMDSASFSELTFEEGPINIDFLRIGP